MANTKKGKSWHDEDLKIAESLYMDFMNMSDIAKETGIPRTTLIYHAKSYWKPLRDASATEKMKEWAEANKPEMSRITRASVKIMDRALQALSKRREPPTMKEAIDASKVFQTMDTIARLDKADSLDERNAPVEQLNSNELLDRLQKADPFFESAAEKESKDEDKPSN